MMRLFSSVPAVFLLLPALLGPPNHLRAQERLPYTLEQIEELLAAHLAPNVILAMVRVDCVAFRVDDDARKRLTAAGGSEEFVRSLGEVCYRGPEPKAEEQPEARREPEPPPSSQQTSMSFPYSPGSAALRSLLVPGLGQFYTGRKALGAVFLAGWAGALGFGLMSEKVTVECLAQTSDACPAGQVRSQVSERPMLVAGIGAAVAVAVISAFEARAGARKANVRRAAALAATASGGRVVLKLLPAPDGPPQGGLVLLQLRRR